MRFKAHAHVFGLLLGLLVGFTAVSPVWAIPPNTPITNTASVDFSVVGVGYSVQDSQTVVTDPGAGNSPPYDLTLSPATVTENVDGGSVGAIIVVDLDPTDTHTYTVSDLRFTVVNGTLVLLSGQSIDFETEPTVTLTVTVTDSSLASYTEEFVLSVVDVNEAPTDISLDDQELVAGILGANVGTITVLDQDAGDSHVFSLDDARFEVVNGLLKLRDDQALNLGEVVTVMITATDVGGLFYNETFTISAIPPGGTAGVNSSIGVLQYARGVSGAQATNIGLTQCDAGAGLVNLPPVVGYGQGAINLPGSIDLLATNILKSGDVLFVQVLDPDANSDNTQIDTLSVDLQTTFADLETIVVTETAVNTGIFVGYIQTVRSSAIVGSCSLEIDQPQSITLSYRDVSDALDLAVINILVDPFGVVFDSATGNPINGARISIIDAQTNAPAQVFSDDGVSLYPSSVNSGDAGLDFTDGMYRFPFIAAGNYVLEVIPPNRFGHPSAVADASLQILPGAPFALGPGARGQVFQVPVGPAIRVDIPLDLQPITPSESSMALFAALSTSTFSSSEYIGASQCFDGTNFTPSPAIVTLSQGPLAVPANLNMTSSNRFARGDVLFIRVTDPDQDLDPFAADTLIVNVAVQGGGDLERVELVETNDSTGIFSGYLVTSTGVSATINNCQLEASAGAVLEVQYQDPTDQSDTTVLEALYDPAFTTFSSANGELVSGATVTLIDAVSGLPAIDAVFGVDGVSTYPVSVVVGDGATDSSGQRTDFAVGAFSYPVVTPGRYRLDVSAPLSYSFPTVSSDAQLNALAGGPFSLIQGSRGEEFDVTNGTPPGFDVPLDPISAEIFVTKQASKEVAGIGEFVQYLVRVENGDASGTVTSAAVHDTLPLGFRFVQDSLRIDAQGGVEPTVTDTGRELVISIPNIEPGGVVEVRYVTEITSGAKLGRARNKATVIGTGVGEANIAFADVQVNEDLMQSKAIILGQVYANGCLQTQVDALGMPNIRIWLEDGTFVVTDQEGKFHIEGIEPGTHVVQLDSATIPASHEIATCAKNTRFAGASHSQFVDMQAGTVWRADFYLKPKPNQVSEVISQLDSEAIDGRVHYTYRVKGGAVPLENFRATLMLDDQLAFLEGSARLNGESIPDPSGIEMGAPTFKLPDTNSQFEYRLDFDTFVKNSRGEIVTKAVAMFASEAGSHRSAVNTNELSLNWPSSLIIVAESIGGTSEPLKSRTASSKQNRYVLTAAREVNAHSLPLEQRSLLRDARKDRVDDALRTNVSIQTEVHEPSRGSQRVRSNISRTLVSIESDTSTLQPYELPQPDRGEAPPFDLTWLATNKDNHGILWPPENYNPALPAIAVTVVHAKELKPVLLVDGEIASPITFEGATTDHKLGISFSRWDNVTISEHDSLIEARLLNADGKTVQAFEREVHFSGAPAKAEFVASESYLVADGLYAPVVAVRLFDRAGHPLRTGTTGEFSILPPYVALDRTKHLESLDNKLNNQKYRVLRDGIAYIQLEPTTKTGEVEIYFEFDSVRRDTIRARMVPGARDWIMVGLLEGTYAQNEMSGNDDALAAHGLDNENLTDGRLAFYAKGMVKGDWLLTAAYDTDKKFERRLREQIDPNQFYTLYGDGTEQLYDAESQRKLYLKLERSRFAALFGDFETGFDRSELGRYDRRMNGLNVNYFGEQLEISMFASNTDQAFVRDEIPGDGTSGVYRLSRRSLVVNSESVRIVTRDRFNTQNVLEAAPLTRFSDYTIDYDRGQLIFKQPIFSQDGGFNPIFIEVEYEVANEGADEEIVAGTRVAYRLDQQDSEISLTYVNDGTEGQGGDLLAGDLTWQFNSAQKLTIEYAQTDTDLVGPGRGYLVELEHASERIAGRFFAREQEQNFGLGHQPVLEAGTRKIGIEGEFRFNKDILLRAQTFQQTSLQDNTQRLVVNALGEWQYADTKYTTGIQSVQEDTVSGDTQDATQLLFGVARNFMHNKLTLRSDAEVDISSGDGNGDYPSRAIVGAEYEIMSDVHLIAEQELTWGDARDTQDTRFGVRARPWTGADVNSIVTSERGENGDRLFSTTGLLQQWRFNERWLIDLGFDRVQTLSESGTPNSAPELLANPRVPPASGSFDGDFTAFFTGFGYRRNAWDISSRLEFHLGDESDKWNFLTGANHQLDRGKVISASMSMVNEELANGTVSDNTDLRVGFAWRPFDSPWSFLNRTDLVFDRRENTTFDTRTRKWVNNFNANYKPGWKHQLAVQVGLKYVVENIDDEEYDSVTALVGLEYRYDLTPKWDFSVRSSTLASFGANNAKHSYGLSVGHNVAPNMWLSVGYNVEGFDDDDFIAADYTARGPYLKLRLKFDEAIAKRFLAFAGLANDTGSRSFANGR